MAKGTVMEGLRFSVARGCCDDTPVTPECANCVPGTMQNQYVVRVTNWNIFPIFNNGWRVAGGPFPDRDVFNQADVNEFHTKVNRDWTLTGPHPVRVAGALFGCYWQVGHKFLDIDFPGEFIPGTLVDTAGAPATIQAGDYSVSSSADETVLRQRTHLLWSMSFEIAQRTYRMRILLQRIDEVFDENGISLGFVFPGNNRAASIHEYVRDRERTGAGTDPFDCAFNNMRLFPEVLAENPGEAAFLAVFSSEWGYDREVFLGPLAPAFSQPTLRLVA